MLRRLHKEMVEDHDLKLERKKSKRQRLLQFFRWKKLKPQSHNEISILVKNKTSQSPPHNVATSESAPLEQPNPPPDSTTFVSQSKQGSHSIPTPLVETVEEEKVEALGEAQIHALFTGAPQFGIKETDNGRARASVTYPWDVDTTARNYSDVALPNQPAYLAASVNGPSPNTQTPQGNAEKHKAYDVDAVEVPNMLSAQGIEPGSIGVSFFLELPKSDSLMIDVEQSHSSKDFLEATRNKELFQTNPERVGIRNVDMAMVHDRLIEIQDLYETFQDSPESATVLNQDSGNLYANLFSKFLSPPGFDGSSDDPTGLQVQIIALLRTLRLKGFWYDFSLVEWRIRLGQILWSEPEPAPEHETTPLWTERDILLLQITLACELLLRLDALSGVNSKDATDQVHVRTQDIHHFRKLKSRKIDWDLILARRFLNSIMIVKPSDPALPSSPKSRGFLSLLGVSPEPEPSPVDIIFHPKHQSEQLSGLSHFAKSMHWPNLESFSVELAQKLGVHESKEQSERPLSVGRSFDPSTPSSISIYGTPLQTPRSGKHLLDGYFGKVGKPNLSRNDSRSLRVPLSPTLTLPNEQSAPDLKNIGGWLSRSYLTGFILPGEAISHFLISTLLENDKNAIASLGDSANLYGGFSYADRAWWSKNSIVGRVLACLEGSSECMGWISFTRLPEGLADSWHSIHSEQLPLEDRLRNADAVDLIAQNSAVIPAEALPSVKAEDFVCPTDPDLPPTPSFAFTQWELTPLNPDLIDSDTLSASPTETDVQVPTIIFSSPDQSETQTITLAFDVQFITSWPCSPPVASPAAKSSFSPALRRSLTETLSRSSSKRSETLSRRNSHGFEPLLSHPPDAEDIAPKRIYPPDPEDGIEASLSRSKPTRAHPLHKSYSHKVVSAASVLDPNFALPFATHVTKSALRSSSLSHDRKTPSDTNQVDKKAVLILDARASTDLELLARAWCAEKGYHAIISRTERTCLACSIREARGVGINIVIRV
ncbi:hypothetical protein IQ07DRAFT_509914 [Pyrenochaeta sp. DS3sAY3a]|nr:hypothetical protein IQ07DRAFT_509914 [Pyrenochaeta sp. DS3sAY3a]